MLDKDNFRDVTLFIVMVIVVLGTFGLLYLEIEIPSWLVGAFGSIISGGLGIGIKGSNNGT